MSMNVFELFAKLGLDTSEYENGLEGAESSASSFGSTLTKGIGVAAGVTTAAITATTAATVAGAKAFVEGVSSVAEYGDNIDKMSQKMNMSAESYQEWAFVMEHSGTTIDSMQASIKTLSTAAETGSEAFEALGLSQEEIANMSSEELFSATITALQNVEDETERTYLAGQLLGRGATELGALLNMSAEETEAMKQEVHDLGGVLSDQAVEDAAAFQDSLQNMQTSFDGLKNSMLTEFLPSFSTVMDGLSLVFSGSDIQGGLDLIEDGVNDLAENITEVAPRFIQIGGTILTALSGSILDNLPTLLESGAQAVSEIALGVIDHLDEIIPAAISVIETIGGALVEHEEEILNAGANILLMLVDGVASRSEEIIPTIIQVIHTAVSVLTRPDVLSVLIEGGLQIISGLASGLAVATPELVGMIPELIANLILTLVDVAPELGETVLSLLGSLGMSIIGSILGLTGMTFDEIGNAFLVIDSMLVNFGAGVILWFDDAWNFVSTWFGNAIDGLGNFVADIIEWIVNLGTSVSSNISSFFTNASSTVLSFSSNILGYISGGIDNIKDYVSAGLEAVESTFTNIFDNVKDTVENSINFIKGLFDFEWSLPDIKLPHFKISGSLDLLATPPSIPTVKVEWYAKAMNQPYLLDSATIFGASGGKLLGGGESGTEVVAGANKLMEMIKQAVSSEPRSIVLNVYGAEGQDIRALAQEVSKELQNILDDKEKVYA